LTPVLATPSKLEIAQAQRVRWNPRSLGIIVLVWIVLHIGCLFTPGLLDDVDSVYLEIAREMLARHNYVTPYVDGIRFFDKPPLMYWLAAGSMKIFGVHDWAGRLPLALLTLGLLIATYALALRLFRSILPVEASNRAALYSALAVATSIGPYLYTRFYIPDIAVTLWLTLAIHAFLVALERIKNGGKSALLPCLAFAVVTALNILSKGLIGLVFPIAFVVLYLAITLQLRLLRKFRLFASIALFLTIAAPWHFLAAIQNPPIPLPAGLGLPSRGGWAWFYLYNEHVARFLSRRIPHDYGQVPIPLFWVLAAIWVFPWVSFVPSAVWMHIGNLRAKQGFTLSRTAHSAEEFAKTIEAVGKQVSDERRVALVLLLWAGVVLGFFTLSARQEYYSLPAIPALALMAGGLLAAADRNSSSRFAAQAERATLAWHKWLLVPVGAVGAAIAFYFAITAPHVDPHTDIASLLTQNGEYDLSLGHLFDLTSRAMGLFRGPLAFFGLSMLTVGPVAWLLRRGGRTYIANLSLATGGAGLLLCMHAGLVRFYPALGCKELARAVVAAQKAQPKPEDLIVIDGELTSGSSMLFYTHEPVHLVNGRINGPWYGSFWPDAPQVFENDLSLRQLWASPHRIFLLTYHPDLRVPDLSRFGPVRTLASAGGKSILVNQP
jgi:4-amino-4-deoxy-L-arabinose transferase-like glycosyltransferase